MKIYYIVTFIELFSTVYGNPCKTPKNEPGDCIAISNCKEMLRILKSQPAKPADIIYLQDSTCDVSGPEPKVCCPKPVTNVHTKPHTASKISDVIGQDLTAHRNFKLLPNVTECGQSTLTDRIINGTDAGLGSYPWMVLIGVQAKDEPVQYICGGTLINTKYVLTAAHCVANLPYGFNVKTVRLGEYDQRTKIDCEKTSTGLSCAPPVQDVDVEEILAHEDYNKLKRSENDIALLRIKKPAVLGRYVSLVCIPRGEKLAPVSTARNEAFVAGWGRTVSRKPENAPVLQVATLKFVSMDVCNKFYSRKANFGEKLDEGRFCASGANGMTDSCKGDSGGPLMLPLMPKSLGGAIRIFQYGVVSLGPKECAKDGQPALYTKVSNFLKWILDNIRQ